MSHIWQSKKLLTCTIIFLYSKWVKHNLIGNDWVWFGPTSLIWLWMKGGHSTSRWSSESIYLSPKCCYYPQPMLWATNKKLFNPQILLTHLIVFSLLNTNLSIILSNSQYSLRNDRSNMDSWAFWPNLADSGSRCLSLLKVIVANYLNLNL